VVGRHDDLKYDIYKLQPQHKYPTFLIYLVDQNYKIYKPRIFNFLPTRYMEKMFDIVKKSSGDYEYVHNVCIFKSKRKNFDIYLKGLLQIIRSTTNSKNMIRIFLSEVSYNFSDPHVEVIKYKFPEEDTTGTFARLAPMFDFYRDDRYQSILDVDTPMEYFNFEEKVKIMQLH
jgi:hypothetical protein